LWTRAASLDLTQIKEYIDRDNPVAALSVVMEIVSVAEVLISEHTRIGKAGRVPGTLEFVIPDYPSYILIYKLSDDAVQILRVLHAARKWPT
jgi:addiction module RelE/StbE family toxin